jgi:hypothetical protein
MAKSVRRARPRAKSNVIYLQQRFPGRFQGPRGDRFQRIIAILQSATQASYYGQRQAAALEAVIAVLSSVSSGARS